MQKAKSKGLDRDEALIFLKRKEKELKTRMLLCSSKTEERKVSKELYRVQRNYLHLRDLGKRRKVFCEDASLAM